MKHLLIFFLVAAMHITAHAQDGKLDLSFGKNGIVRTDFPTTTISGHCREVLPHPDGSMYLVIEVNEHTYISHHFNDGRLDMDYGVNGSSMPLSLKNAKAVIQQDGKIVVGGTIQKSTLDFRLARFNTNGSFDTGFSGDGKVFTDFSNNDDQLVALSLQDDGKIVAAGTTSSQSRTSNQFAVARYNTDGSDDNSFSDDGKQTVGFFDPYANAYDVAVHTDGTIVVVGASGHMLIARLNANGTPDNAFAGTGKRTIQISNRSLAQTVAIQADGKIVIGGATSTSANNVQDWDVALLRLNVDGTDDVTFAGDGLLTTDYGSPNVEYGFPNEGVLDVAVQADGKILAAGLVAFDLTVARYNPDGSADNSFTGDGFEIRKLGLGFTVSMHLQPDGRMLFARSSVLRYNQDGTIDNSFDGDGSLTVSQSWSKINRYLGSVVQPDGKLLVSGYAVFQEIPFYFVTRYHLNGSIDNSFSEDGMVFIPFPIRNNNANYVSSLFLSLQSDGKIVVAGTAFNESQDFAVLRLNPDGGVDNTFSNDGKRFLDLNGTDDYVNALAIQTDGKILAAGSSETAPWALVRFNSDGTIDSSFSADGRLTQHFGTQNYGLNAVIIQGDGKILVVGSNWNEIIVARYLANGEPDAAYGSGSMVTTTFGGSTTARAAVLQPDGKLLVAGSTRLDTWHSAVVRYNNDGSLDKDFSDDGKLMLRFGGIGEDDFSMAFALALQKNGKIIVAGHTIINRQIDLEFAIARLDADGTPDNTFANDGKLVADFEGADQISSLGIWNNRLYVVGNTEHFGYRGTVVAYQVTDHVKAPVAKAVVQQYNAPTSVVLSAAGSYDPDGGNISYTWQKLSAPPGDTSKMSYGNTASAVITGLKAGEYTYQLTVTNTAQLTATTTVRFTVIPNLPPVAGTALQKYLSPTSVLLAAWGSYDPEGGPIKYLWEKTAGPGGAALLYENSASPVINGLVNGTYAYLLTVTDNQGATGTSTLSFTVSTNLPPVAGAWLQKFYSPTSAILAAWGSYDPEGGPITYDWQKMAGPDGSTLIYGNSASPVINWLVNGTYTYRLTVTDDHGATGWKELTFTVSGVPLSSNRSQSLIPADENANPNKAGQFIIYPNPVKDMLNFRWVNEYTGDAMVTVMDISGRKIKNLGINKTAAHYNGSIELTGLKPGQYYLHISNESKTFTSPFVKN